MKFKMTKKMWVIVFLCIALLVAGKVYLNSTISLVNVTKSVSPGNKAHITIQGMPNTKYRISVHYASGRSKASGLVPKKSDSYGKVTWTWNVGTRTTSGNWGIVIKGGGGTFKTKFNVR